MGKILLFGVSCVGKSTVGKLVAESLAWRFYDLDEEVKRRRGTTLEEFVKTGSLWQRDNYRAHVINEIISREENLVLAVTPISFADNLHNSLKNGELLLIELYDTPYHIFQRLVFSDEEDNIYRDDRYKNAHKAHYIREIEEDLKFYGAVNASLGTIRFNVDNDSPERIRDRIITEYIQGGRK